MFFSSSIFESVDEIIPPIDENGFYKYIPGTAYGPKKQNWIYTTPNPTDLFSSICSSAQRLPNGNTLICSASQGMFLEVNNEDKIVWRYDNPYPLLFIQKSVTEAIRYPPDYPGIHDIKSYISERENLNKLFNNIKYILLSILCQKNLNI